MSTFSAEWLSLREPVDARSRSHELVLELGARLPTQRLHALDLGSGTGANIRYLAARLNGQQQWSALDNDAALIKQQAALFDGMRLGHQLSSRQFELATDLDSLPIDGCDLVTASALLDLVSAAWLQSLAMKCAHHRAAVMFALNYDGRVQCSPRDSEDEWLIGLVNRHQHGDKGFGPALGPDAARYACELFARLGFEVRTSASDWLIEPSEQSLQRELIAGWVHAACEVSPSEARRIEQWSARRVAHLSEGSSRIDVGHQDLIAWPTTRDV